MTIKTNHKPRPIIYGFELTPKERADFDYYDSEELDHASFFRYKGQVYDLSEFQRITPCDDSPVTKWHGIMITSYFSSLLIRLSDCGESVTVGAFYS